MRIEVFWKLLGQTADTSGMARPSMGLCQSENRPLYESARLFWSARSYLCRFQLHESPKWPGVLSFPADIRKIYWGNQQLFDRSRSNCQNWTVRRHTFTRLADLPRRDSCQTSHRKPLVIHVHATDFDRSRQCKPQVFAIEKDGMNCADHIICVSDLTRKTVIEKYHIDPQKVTTVHNAVEPISPEIEAIEPKRNTKDKVVTFLGRITMQK